MPLPIIRRGSAGHRKWPIISWSTSLPRTPRVCAICSAVRAFNHCWSHYFEPVTRAGVRCRLLVKIAPDLTAEEREDIASVALAAGVDGLIVSNTTVDRPAGLVSRYAMEPGGLSGRPLFAPSTALLADMYRLTRGRLPLIGVGGVGSAAEAYQKIRAGACLVQLYTALVFAGPGLVTDIKKGLAELLRRRGFYLRCRSGRCASGAFGWLLGTGRRGGGAVLVVFSWFWRSCAVNSFRLPDELLELALRLTNANLATRIAPRFGHQSALVVPRRVDARIPKRAPQPFCPSEGVVAVPPISLEQWSDQQFHFDHCSSSKRSKLSNLRAERSRNSFLSKQASVIPTRQSQGWLAILHRLRWASTASRGPTADRTCTPEACSVKFGNIQ